MVSESEILHFFCYNHVWKYNYCLFTNVELRLRHINVTKSTELITIRAGSVASPGLEGGSPGKSRETWCSVILLESCIRCLLHG
jgi:hypothetical protein